MIIYDSLAARASKNIHKKKRENNKLSSFVYLEFA